MPLALLWTAATVVATSAVALATPPRGMLHARTEIIAHAGLYRLLHRRLRIFRRSCHTLGPRRCFGMHAFLTVGVFGVLIIQGLAVFFRYLLLRFFVGRIDFFRFQTAAVRLFGFVRRSFLMPVFYFFFRLFLRGIDFFRLHFGVGSRTVRVRCG